MLQIYELIRRVNSKISCMILGESGTGKEMVARSIHAAGPRKSPFCRYKLWGNSETLVESELFGHKKGHLLELFQTTWAICRQRVEEPSFLMRLMLPLGTQVKLSKLAAEKSQSCWCTSRD